MEGVPAALALQVQVASWSGATGDAHASPSTRLTLITISPVVPSAEATSCVAPKSVPPGQLTVTWIVTCWPTGTGTEILPSGPKLPVARTLPPGPITAKVPPLQPAGNWAPSARRSLSCSAEVVVGPLLLPLLPH